MIKKWVSIFCLIFLMVTTVVWAKPDSAYIDNGDGTVTDIETNLMWQQATAPGIYNWNQAISYCESLSLAGYTDWRLPTLDELKTLVDKSWGYKPTINRTFFPDTVSSFYWSSTTLAYDTSPAWGVNFNDGDDNYGYKSYSYYVRAVRGGQAGSLDNLVISPLGQTVTMKAGSTTFSVSNTGTGNIPWKTAVTAGADWLSISSGAGGTNTGTITCAYTANTSTSSRTGTIRVTAYGDDSTSTQKDVTVAQASSISSYVDNGNGTVTDTSSSLIWQQATAPNTYNWDQAISYCESLSFAGYTDWRLPTLNELNTLVDSTQTPPTINQMFFPGTVSSFYWSSTTSANYAGGVDFSNGGTSYKEKFYTFYVRAVRGGQPKPTACTATTDGNLLLHIPYLSYIDPASVTLSFLADLVNELNPTYPMLILFKLTNLKVIENPSFSCAASTLSSDFKIHIPDFLLPDGITRLWVDMEYSQAFSTDMNVYFEVKSYGFVSN